MQWYSRHGLGANVLLPYTCKGRYLGKAGATQLGADGPASQVGRSLVRSFICPFVGAFRYPGKAGTKGVEEEAGAGASQHHGRVMATTSFEHATTTFGLREGRDE